MIKTRAKEVLRIESEAVRSLINRIDDTFEKAVDLMYACKGRVVVTGMGKGGLIGQKISATLSSVGTPSLWMHSVEAIHGDLGRVSKEDIVIVISKSGETEEIRSLLPLLKKIGTKIIALTGNTKSTLAKYSNVVLDTSVKKEACSLNLAPTASTTAMLAMGDALAVCLLDKKGFKKEDFAFYHPGGMLGKQLLLTVEDIMRMKKSNPVVNQEKKIKDVLLAITKARAGSASIVDKKGKLVGIFTDGDLRRHLEVDANLSEKKVKDVMTKRPTTVTKETLAAEALRILQERKIDEVPVVDKKGKPIGLLDVQDLLKAGLV
ncbi:MAG: KpsF/GutQ family sugar-phosphate isomerase [Candidatus Omnitrophica bacterium]|nr:KpsF/GutQ family sugar-phosphate isomerase [Candidatus Omnitrophota bacterium]HOX54642.1 KpsF/GutQ family sugar-phosphate isomerase [Candidatus Omnitrophota bacterium]